MSLTARQLSQAAKRKSKLLEIVSAFPGTTAEDLGKDHLAIRIRKKIFAYYLFDHHGDDKIAFCCKSSLSEQRRLIREDPDLFFSPAYMGPRGWVTMRLDLDDLNWDVVQELLKRAYQKLAPKKLAALVE